MREEVAFDVVHLGSIDERGDLGRGEVLLLELLCRGKRGDEGAVVARDDDRARAGLLALLDEVDLVKALALVRLLELLREIVVADAAGVDDRVWGEDVLCMGACV